MIRSMCAVSAVVGSGGATEAGTDDVVLSLNEHKRLRHRRAIDECPESVMRRLSPTLRMRVMNQLAIDRENDEYTTSLGGTDGAVLAEEVPGVGTLVIGPRLAQGRYSTVFAVENRPDLIIKYQANCDSLGKWVHPLLLDYWLAQAAAESARRAGTVNPVALVFFLAPPTGLNTEFNPKTDFRALEPETAECARNGGTVRFLVMERLDSCFDSVVKEGLLTPADAIENARKLVDAVDKLHAAGVIHGDIHQGNVCQRAATPSDVTFIDFGLGDFADAATDAIGSLPERGQEFRNPWQLQGKQGAMRGDVYDAIYLAAQLMLGKEVDRHGRKLLKSLPVDPATGIADSTALLDWKLNGFIFRTPTFDPISLISGVDVGAVETVLAEALARVTALGSVKDPITYAIIKFDLFRAARLLKVTDSIVGDGRVTRVSMAVQGTAVASDSEGARSDHEVSLLPRDVSESTN